MLVPRFLLGSFPDVRRQTLRYLRSLSSGEDAKGVELVDTRSHPGLIVLDDQEGFHAEAPNFQMHAIFELSGETKYRDMEPHIFDAVVAHPWGPLAILGSAGGMLWVHHVIAEASWTMALSQTAKWWDVYCAEGRRFSWGSRTDDLWPLAGMVKVLLRQKGVPESELVTPLPAGGLRALLARHGAIIEPALGAAQAEDP
jgi:hypothetical protein